MQIIFVFYVALLDLWANLNYIYYRFHNIGLKPRLPEAHDLNTLMIFFLFSFVERQGQRISQTVVDSHTIPTQL